MFARNRGWARWAIGVLLGCGMLAGGDRAGAQTGNYVGDKACMDCHNIQPGEPNPRNEDLQIFDNYKKHGHPWMQVHWRDFAAPGATEPPADLYAPVGQDLPALRQESPKITWDMVNDIVGNFKDGHGDVLIQGGNMYPPPPATNKYEPMRGACNACHNTGSDANGSGGRIAGPGGVAYNDPAIKGSWVLNGIQCERCHGAGISQAKGGMQIPDKQICRDCHSSGDSKARIPLTATLTEFNNHHPEGDEYRRSPHKNDGCILCHDPHKSVWHNEGGVKFADPKDEQSIGMMCTQCHTNRIRGTMGLLTGDAKMKCTDCHMPEISGVGERVTHLMRINSSAVRPDNGLPNTAANNYKIEPNDSNAQTKFWMNTDGTTEARASATSPDLNKDSFITLDLACARCHKTETLQQFAAAAPFVHRNYGMIDLLMNGVDPVNAMGEVVPQTVKATDPVNVTLALQPDARDKMLANWVCMMQGPTGWFSYNGTKWVRGQAFWKRNAPLAEQPATPVFNSTLAPGKYTFHVGIYPQDGSKHEGRVPVTVTAVKAPAPAPKLTTPKPAAPKPKTLARR